MLDKEQGKKLVQEKVELFLSNRDQYKLPEYKEERVMKEFIDRFFLALGWDINNDQGLSERYKEVINQDAIKIGSTTKAPDYAFRIGGQRVFFVEAKKPSIKIKEDQEAAYQLRRYAWNTKIPISILTNFEEFAVYDCRIKPNIKDDASVARVMLIKFEDYPAEFNRIYDIFSKEAVLRGSFDSFAESSRDKKGTSQVDNEFLKEIESWRERLAKNIALRNPNLSVPELNYSVQSIIDRILFLIICEYRNIEIYGTLKSISEGQGAYKELLKHFQKAEEKYDSGIFDFERDKLTKTVQIDDNTLHDIIVDLYYPKSPYDFSVLSIEILGSVYERFLGKTIRLTEGHHAKVEEKPEVRKAGGVYYTPEYVVDYIVKSTVGRLIEGKTPKQIESIRILDPACGSGTFLVRAYSYLLDYHLNYYKKDPRKYKKEIYQIKENQWFLTTEIRKKILTNNIFGVDIDPQAVELTKLSLILKVLENETKETVNQQLKLFQERVLPDLDANIRCGNSVVDSTYFTTIPPDQISQQELLKVNPFDWNNKEKGFGRVLDEGGFDVIIGNPPYIKEYTEREIFEIVKRTNLKKYYQGKMDFWYFFTCQAIDMLKENGLHSFIAPSNWITNAGAQILRDKILTGAELISFFDFADFKVFKDASIQTMVFVLEKAKREKYSVEYYKIIDDSISKEELRNYLLTNKDGKRIEHFKVGFAPSELVGKTFTFTHSQFNEILRKIKNIANYQFKEQDITQGIVPNPDFVNIRNIKLLHQTDVKPGDGVFVLEKTEKLLDRLAQKEKDYLKPYLTDIKKNFVPDSNEIIFYLTRHNCDNIDELPHIRDHLINLEQ